MSIFKYAVNTNVFALKCIDFSGWISMEELATEDHVREIFEGIAFMKGCAEAAPTGPCEPFTHFNE